MLRTAVIIQPPTKLEIAALVLQAPLIALFVVFGLTGSLNTAVICCLATLPSAVLLATYFGTRRFDLFSPLLAVTLPVLVGTSLRTIYLVFCTSGRAEQILHGYGVLDLLPAVIIVGVACASLAIGYTIAANFRFELKPLLGTRGSWSKRHLDWLCIGCALLAIVCTVDLLGRTGFELDGSLQSLSTKRRLETHGSSQGFTSFGYHSWGSKFLPSFAIYACLAAGAQRNFRVSRGVIIGLTGIVVIASFLASDRMSICALALNLLIIFRYRRQVSLPGIAAAVSILLIVFSGLVLIRDGVLTREGIIGKNTNSYLLLDSIIGNENFVDIVRVQRVYDGVPDELPYKYGIDFVSWVVAPIPRVFWDEKPSFSPGLEISRDLYGADARQTSIGVKPPGLINQLIINFGTWSVPLGMFVFGAGLRIVYNTLNPLLYESPLAWLVYISFYLPFGYMLMGGGFSRSMIILLQGLVTTSFITLFAFRRKAPSRVPMLRTAAVRPAF